MFAKVCVSGRHCSIAFDDAIIMKEKKIVCGRLQRIVVDAPELC